MSCLAIVVEQRVVDSLTGILTADYDVTVLGCTGDALGEPCRDGTAVYLAGDHVAIPAGRGVYGRIQQLVDSRLGAGIALHCLCSREAW